MEPEKVPTRNSCESATQSSTESYESACLPDLSGARLMMFTNQPLLAHGVRCLLLDKLSAGIILASGPAESLASVVIEHQPDILLVDLTPEISVTILSQTRTARPETRIIVMASALSWEMAHQLKIIGVISMLKRNCTLLEFVTAFSQGSYAACRLDEPADDGAEIGEIVHLSRREGQLVMLLSQGLKNKEMAQCLGISEGTIRVYLSKLYMKIGVNDRFELALFGLRNSANLPAIWPDVPETDASAATHVPSLRSLWLRRSRAGLVAGMAAAAARA
jgi:two-component system nitrate/nitrite response regulator NarL